MIEERILAVDDLWAVIRDQRERVDRLVAQAERQQDELARLRGENRRLIELLERTPIPSAATSLEAVGTPTQTEVDRLTETPVVPVPVIETGPAIVTTEVRTRERTRSRPAIASWRTIAAAVVLAICGVSAFTIDHSSAAPVQHPPHSHSLAQR